MYSVGGASYSQQKEQWGQHFGSADAARQLAQTVSQWKCDGVDIDFEQGVGDDAGMTANLLVFL